VDELRNSGVNVGMRRRRSLRHLRGPEFPDVGMALTPTLSLRRASGEGLNDVMFVPPRQRRCTPRGAGHRREVVGGAGGANLPGHAVHAGEDAPGLADGHELAAVDHGCDVQRREGGLRGPGRAVVAEQDGAPDPTATKALENVTVASAFTVEIWA